MASGLLHAIKAHSLLEKIDQQSFESSHSQMESDSIHSAVEHSDSCSKPVDNCHSHEKKKQALFIY